jgi:hypothetical protein
MKNLTLYFYMLSITLITVSACSDDPGINNGNANLDTSAFTYPTSIGSVWNYGRVFSAFNIRPDSVRPYLSSYPFYSSGNITVVYDTLINGIMTKCFLERYTEIHGNDTMTFHARHYYANTDTALLCIAYRSGFGGSGIPFSSNHGIKFGKKGRVFPTLREVLNYMENGNPFQAAGDSLIIHNIPSTVLKYPIVTNTEWISHFHGILIKDGKILRRCNSVRVYFRI